MRYLLDTSVLLWWMDDDQKIKPPVYKIIRDKNNQVLVSVVSATEISIKNRAGKLPLKTSMKHIFELSGFEVLDINLNHIIEFDKLSSRKDHKDPFDRILISQAKAENLTLITSDPKIWKYKVSLLKA